MSAEDALYKYSRRNSGIKKPRKENSSPEKEVEKEVQKWCEEKGFDISVVESKAVFSRAAGRYLRGQTKAGFSDMAGVCPDGTGAFIELKAKSRLNTISHSQFEFLLSKIRKGAFACCVDSANLLNDIFLSWSSLREKDSESAKSFLISALPCQKFLKRETDDLSFE